MSKYGAVKARSPLWPGVVFASQAERDRADWLRAEQDEGRINDLELHPTYVLSEKPSCKVTFDARYRRLGCLTVEDVKGAVARDFRVRALWFRQLNPGVRVVVVKRDPASLTGWGEKEIR